MSAPFYVSPEQWYGEKAEYARKGIAKGRPIVALDFEDGILLLAENRHAFRKLAEIYDNIAFAAVGKLDEYDTLRKAGVRYADLKGFTYSRDDVAAVNLASEYSSWIGNAFTREMKPFEVEILVCEVGDKENQYYQILFDGFISDQRNFATIGGEADKLRTTLREQWKEGMSLPDALRTGVAALESSDDGSAKLDETTVEVAMLDRKRTGRRFRRFEQAEVKELLGH